MKDKKFHFRVDYSYCGSKEAWFEMDSATHKQLHKALASIYSNHFTVHNMAIRNLTHELWTNESP